MTSLAVSTSLLCAATLSRPAHQVAASLRHESELLQRIRAAHFRRSPAPGLLSSYSLRVCVIPKQSGPASSCVKGELGVASTSTAFLSAGVGGFTHFQVVTPESEWQMVSRSATSAGDAAPRTAKLDSLKSQALREQARHSLPSLLARLTEQKGGGSLSVRDGGDSPLSVLVWVDGDVTNEFYFNPTSLLCEKQVRKTPAGVTVMKFSDYKPVAEILLPHRIEVGPTEDQIIATQMVEGWRLGVAWPPDFFTPGGMLKNIGRDGDALPRGENATGK